LEIDTIWILGIAFFRQINSDIQLFLYFNLSKIKFWLISPFSFKISCLYLNLWIMWSVLWILKCNSLRKSVFISSPRKHKVIALLQRVLLRRESQSYWCSIRNNNIVFAHFNCTSHIYSFYFVILSPGLYVCVEDRLTIDHHKFLRLHIK
jgi:hypothetical protein